MLWLNNIRLWESSLFRSTGSSYVISFRFGLLLCWIVIQMRKGQNNYVGCPPPWMKLCICFIALLQLVYPPRKLFYTALGGYTSYC